MAEIFTSRGMMPVSALTFSEGVAEDDAERRVTWQEWRAPDGEIVKREVQLHIKKPLDIGAVAGGFNG